MVQSCLNSAAKSRDWTHDACYIKNCVVHFFAPLYLNATHSWKSHYCSNIVSDVFVLAPISKDYNNNQTQFIKKYYTKTHTGAPIPNDTKEASKAINSHSSILSLSQD